MAKLNKSVVFKNATIDLNDNTITETLKNGENIYDLKKLLDEWNGVEGISITIKQDDDIPTDSEE